MATCLSGIQPTGRFHIGNYLGCIRQFVARQKQRPTDKKHIFLIADLHCFTKPERVSDLGGQVLETARSLIALGVDPSHVNVVRQSKVAHDLGHFHEALTVPLGHEPHAAGLVLVVSDALFACGKHDSIQGTVCMAVSTLTQPSRQLAKSIRMSAFLRIRSCKLQTSCFIGNERVPGANLAAHCSSSAQRLFKWDRTSDSILNSCRSCVTEPMRWPREASFESRR